MATDIVPAAQSHIHAIDSLSANEFVVEVEGQRLGGVFRITGLVSFKLDVKGTSSLKTLKEPFKIVKMVQRDPNNPFNQWLIESINAKDDIVRPRRTLSIVAVDDGVEIRRWTVNGAWISEVRYSDFDSGSSELVEETITIQWDDLEETWLANQ
jgi:phage tail-like protein